MGARMMAIDTIARKKKACLEQTSALHTTSEQRDTSATHRVETAQGGFSMNAAIGWILQGGVLVSSAVICVGIGLWVLGFGRETQEQLLSIPHTPGEVWNGVL